MARHGNTADAFKEVMSEETATPPRDDNASPAGAYFPIDELRDAFRALSLHIWREDASIQNDDAALRAFLEKRDSIFEDAIALMTLQGDALIASKLAILKQDVLVDIAKPLVDHEARRRILDTNVSELRRFIDSRDLAITGVDLHQQLENFVLHGEVTSAVLLYVWRDLAHVKPEHYPQILELLNASGLIVVQQRATGTRIAVVFARLPRNPPSGVDEWPDRTLDREQRAQMSVAFECGGCPGGLVQCVVASVHTRGTAIFSWREGVVVETNHDENTTWYYVRLTKKDEKLGVPSLDFVVRTTSQSEFDAHESWFAHVLRVIKTEEANRFPGTGCTAYVECSKCNQKTSVWDSRSSGGDVSDVCCPTCGHRLLATTDATRFSLMSDRDFRADVVRRLGNIERIGTATAAGVDRNFNAMLDLARDGDKFPWLFLVVPAKSSQERFSLFSRRLMVVFVCQDSLERVPYNRQDGLVFTVPTDNVRDALRAASRFWKKYGPIIKFGATALAAIVKAAANFDVGALVPDEAIRAVVGDAAERAVFIDSYAERVTEIVDRGTEYADEFDAIDKARSGVVAASSSSAGGTTRLDESRADALVQRARESYVDFHEFLKSVGFDARKLPMRWVAGGNGRIRWVRRGDVAVAAPNTRKCCSIA